MRRRALEVARRLASAELGRALLEVGRESLPGVLALEEALLQLALEREALPRRSAPVCTARLMNPLGRAAAIGGGSSRA